jgi:hypothetical protein
MFGAYGLHWFVWDAAFTERRVMDRCPGASDYTLREQEKSTDPSKREIARALLSAREGVRQFYRSYEGQEIAFQKCPAYQAAIARGREAA